MNLPHAGIRRFDMAAEAIGVEQRKRRAIGGKALPHVPKFARIGRKLQRPGLVIGEIGRDEVRQADGVKQACGNPAGFMVIKRHVFGRMMERYPELRYTSDGPPDHP